MIAAVIADDLTGAAELASAAADSGFFAEVHSTFDPTSTADVVCLDTNTRTLPPDQADRIVARATRDVLQLKPARLYKKTDSVLRGNVRAEIESVLRAANLTHCLLVPANPSKSRVIRSGTYYVGEIPLSETPFAQDPHHPRTTSDVRALLGESQLRIGIPDVGELNDLHRLAATLTPEALPAGGVDFFRAVLDRHTPARITATGPLTLATPILFCSGSLHGWTTATAREFAVRNIPVLPMPAALRAAAPASDAALDQWAGAVADTMASHPSSAISIGEGCNTPPDLLTARLAQAVARILRSTRISSLVIEGGSTASAVLQHLNLTRLDSLPTPTLEGVAALRPHTSRSPLILLKPGSYPWPTELWSLFNSQETPSGG